MPRCPVCSRRLRGGATCPGDGGIAAEERARDAGRAPRIPGFDIAEVLGAGGAGAVWGASGPTGAAAIKVAHGAGEMWRVRFAREAGALAALGPPHAPRLLGHDILADGRPWIAMERIRGASLAAELTALVAPPDRRYLLAVADAVLAAVEAIHRRGVVHRDLKPEDVFTRAVAGHRVATLADFGLATGAAVPAAIASGWAVGTLGYMAPEVLAGGAGDERADIYALGAILYELCALRPPFAGDAAALERAHLALRPPPPGLFAPIPRDLDALILACLAKEPDRRPPDAATLRRDLRASLDRAATPSTPPPAVSVAPFAADDTAPPHPPPPGDSAPALPASRDAAADPAIGPARSATAGDAAVRDRGLSAATAPAMGGATADRGFPAVRAPAIGSAPADRGIAAATAPPPGAPEAMDRGGAPAPLVDVGAPPRGAAIVASDGGELVALVWIEAGAGPARLAADLARTPGLLARQHGRTCLAVFAAARSDQPARAALSAAQRLLAAWGGRAAVHVDRVELRRRDGRPPAFHGESVDRPEAWLPSGPWNGLLLTRDLIDAIGDLAVVPAGPTGFFAAAGALTAPPPPLVGRAGVVAALEASARRSFTAHEPGLALLVGGPGIGKTRLLGEMAAAASRLGAACIAIDAADHSRRDALEGEALRERARPQPLMVLVDGAHLADDALLDSLEYATLGGAGLPIWILVAADGGALDQIRPRFGERAATSERLELEPLSDDSMRELAASLLLPADYLPAAVLDRLATLAGGNPGLLSELVRALKREGAIRPRPDRRSYELAIGAIERLPATAAGRWEASRALDALPLELAASARVAAAFGPVIDEDELDFVEDALERDGQGSFFAARVALAGLATRSLVVERGGGSWAFASPLVQDAIYLAMPAGERARIHGHALAYWRGREGGRALAAVARHANLAGARDEALAAATALAESAAAAHRAVEAERWYSVALMVVGDQAARMRALVGRGRARWRLDRGREALSDLAAARALARETGRPAELASILLDEAMVLDWYGDVELSAACVEEARPMVDGADDPGLSARLLVAGGRSLWRQERVNEGLELLSAGAAGATDVETRLIALLLSGVARCFVGLLDQADANFAEAENLARAHNDRLHLCAVHVNRIILSIAREDSACGARELRQAVQLARELGHPHVERNATHNLAELLHLECRDGEALPLAIRSFELQQRYVSQPGPEDALLLCRIAMAVGDRESAARHIAWVAAHAPASDAPPTYAVFARALELTHGGGAAAEWDAVVAAAGAAAMRPVEHLEILCLRASCEQGRGQNDAARATFAA
ncbi:MAG TPA: protein kinase, partial [Kofleriaceae bacterium]|nr:protein kinase [Kofleriaceae bacterium]